MGWVGGGVNALADASTKNASLFYMLPNNLKDERYLINGKVGNIY